MTKVKICGITNLADAQAAANAGADFLGFNFYEPSPRYVTPEIVKAIISEIRQRNTFSPLCVGVFVNEAQRAIDQIFDECRLDAVQLHGEESPEFVQQFEGRVFKVLRPKSAAEADELVQRYTGGVTQLAETVQSAKAGHLPDLLLDAYHPTLYGGTGHVTDWTMAANIARQHKIMLAGSLTPDNVGQAIAAVQPWAVDVSSGVELKKGLKDHGKVQEFICAAKQSVSAKG